MRTDVELRKELQIEKRPNASLLDTIILRYLEMRRNQRKIERNSC